MIIIPKPRKIIYGRPDVLFRGGGGDGYVENFRSAYHLPFGSQSYSRDLGFRIALRIKPR